MTRYNVWFYDRTGEYKKIEILTSNKETAVDSILSMDDTIEIDKVIEKHLDKVV
jgi:hypothetical protein